MDSVEALVQACNAGFRVEEVPANMRGRTGGAPSTGKFKLVYYYVRLAGRGRWSSSHQPEPARPRARRGDEHERQKSETT